jgi:hypothetical protein
VKHPADKTEPPPVWLSLPGRFTFPPKRKSKTPRAKPARGAPKFISMTNIWSTRPPISSGAILLRNALFLSETTNVGDDVIDVDFAHPFYGLHFA